MQVVDQHEQAKLGALLVLLPVRWQAVSSPAGWDLKQIKELGKAAPDIREYSRLGSLLELIQKVLWRGVPA